MAFLAVDPDRATEIDFTDAYVHIEGGTWCRRRRASAASTTWIGPGVRIAVAGRSAYDLYLTRHLKHAHDPALRGVRAVARGVPGRAARGHRRHPPAAAARRRTHRRTARARRQLHDDPPGLGGAQGSSAGAGVPRGLHRGRQALGLRGRADAHEWCRRRYSGAAAPLSWMRRTLQAHEGSSRCIQARSDSAVQRSVPAVPSSALATSRRLQRRPASSSIARRAGCRRTWCLRTMRSSLDLDPARDSLRGEVVVTLRVRQPVAAIELHADEIAGRARGAGDGRRRGAQAERAARRRRTTWKLVPDDGAPIAAGEHQLRIAYRGRSARAAPACSGPRPHRRCRRGDAGHAARLDPCPRPAACVRRAGVPRGVRADGARAARATRFLPTCRVAERRAEGAAVVHRFAPTPPMPSYLLALAVGRFDVLEDSAAGVPLRIFTAPGKREQARYAMEVTQPGPAVLQRLLRRALRAAEARPARGARRCARARWRTGG